MILPHMILSCLRLVSLALIPLIALLTTLHAEPALPATMGTVVIPAQEWPLKPTGLDFTFVNVTKDMLDGKISTSTGHALGNRTLIVGEVAGKFLDPKSPDALHRAGATDFDRKEDIRYQTANGTWIISYANGFPVGRFAP